MMVGESGGAVRLLDLETKSWITSFYVPSSILSAGFELQSAEWSENNAEIISARAGDYWIMWQLSKGDSRLDAQECKLLGRGEVSAVKMDPEDCRLIAAVTTEGQDQHFVRILNVPSLTPMCSVSLDWGHDPVHRSHRHVTRAVLKRNGISWQKTINSSNSRVLAMTHGSALLVWQI
jgi:hypothetical protein